MTQLSQIARVTFSDLKREGVTLSSPLEDQTALVYRAAYAHGLTNGFRTYTHRGVPGIKGRMVMARVVHSLFTGTEDELTHSKQLIYQVLRRTDAAVCLNNTRHSGPESQQMPEWFIANSMPKNLTIIALHVGKRSAGGSAINNSTHINEERFLRESEKKLTAREAGEDQTPGEVTVTSRGAPQPTTEGMSRRDAAFAARRQEMVKEHEEIVEQVYEHVATNPQPLTSGDIEVYLMRDGKGRNKTTILKCLRELEQDGKVYSRAETREEAAVRGGGEPPKATRPTLWSTENPVPERRALPPGIEPKLSARAEAERKAEHDILVEDAVLDILRRPYPKGTPSRPRSTGKIAELVPYEQDEVRDALKALVAKGTVYELARGQYYLTERRRQPYNLPAKGDLGVTPTAAGEVATAVPGATATATIPVYANGSEDEINAAKPAVTEGVDNETLVNLLADRLGVSLVSEPEVSQETLDTITAKNARIETLERENDRLRKQLDQIRGALSSSS